MVNWESPLRAKQRMVARMISFERVWFGSGLRGIAVSVEPFPFRWNRNGALSFCFDAFSSRELVSTSLENALVPLAGCLLYLRSSALQPVSASRLTVAKFSPG